jgi:hypothetical protein
VVPTASSFCHCYTSRFAVDGYGRVFLPDVGLFAVRVVDAAANPLLVFGEYGNADDGGTRDDSAPPCVAKPGFAEQGGRGASADEGTRGEGRGASDGKTSQPLGDTPRTSPLAPRPTSRTSPPAPGRIFFAWPYAVSVGKSGLYVSDFLNRRVLRVDLVHAAEETCELK